MESICTQDIISGLFALGYNQVDSIFLTIVIGNISLDQVFKYEEKDFDKTFKKIIEYDGMVYKLKKGLKLDTDISSKKDESCTIKQAFSKNKKLLEYLDKINIQKIVDKKIVIVGISNLKEYYQLFSNKEREFLPKLKSPKKSSKVKQKTL